MNYNSEGNKPLFAFIWLLYLLLSLILPEEEIRPTAVARNEVICCKARKEGWMMTHGWKDRMTIELGQNGGTGWIGEAADESSQRGDEMGDHGTDTSRQKWEARKRIYGIGSNIESSFYPVLTFGVCLRMLVGCVNVCLRMLVGCVNLRHT